ncbi:MAG: winged helix-turn-helix transcriptional regulator [Solirubrobacterales bacterium]|nr:winged helix-turn-helix transcriptional regulator [Solirubrobacterales bacterium]
MDTRSAGHDSTTATVEREASGGPVEAPTGGGSGCALPDDDGGSSLEGDALEAWRSYLQSHATILRMLDAELVSEHGITTRDYEVLLYLAQAPERKLPMSALAERTMLTRSGITRLVDGLVAGGLIERAACASDARVSYAQLTDEGLAKLRNAGCTHVRSIGRLFLEHFSAEETAQLASLLGRLPGAQRGGSCTVP